MWDLYRIFNSVAGTGSLTAAAKALKTSPPTIARRIDQLEEHFSVKLFDRNQEGYSLTEFGRELLPLALEMQEIADKIERKKATIGEKGPSRVRIAAGYWISAFLLQNLSEFSRDNPDISIELVTGYGLADLNRRQADLAIRNSRPTSGRIVCRRLVDFAYAIYGSNSYVNENPVATSEERFARCKWIGHSEELSYLPTADWLNEKLGRLPHVQCTFGMNVHDGINEGLGLGILPRFIGDQNSNLTRLTNSIPVRQKELWLAIHEDLKKAPSTRVVADWIVGTFNHLRSTLDP